VSKDVINTDKSIICTNNHIILELEIFAYCHFIKERIHVFCKIEHCVRENGYEKRRLTDEVIALEDITAWLDCK
jgi:hypothetical protein